MDSQFTPGSKLLLVDDEPLIRMMAEEILADAGFAVTSCGSAEEALALIADGHRPDIMVTDQSMAGMTGIVLADKLAGEIGLTMILIASGGDVDTGRYPCLPKPYRDTELVEAVRALSKSTDPF